MKTIMALIAALVLLPCVFAASWSGSVKTDQDTWSITRESSNLTFTYEQKVAGQISPVDYRGRTLSPYHAFYEDMSLNDVRVRERTAALEGKYSSEELLTLRSSINNSVNVSITKPSGSDLYTIEFYERWPVRLSYSKSMAYAGKQINNREFVGNNRDYVGANFLYNQAFSKERSLNMSLERLNATLFATDEAISSGEVKATRDTQYHLQSHSTGIASFKYLQAGAEDGEVLNAGDERFVGTYDIVKNLHMKSRFDLRRSEDDWLPCCGGGYPSMNLKDQGYLGKTSRGVFDCSCFQAPAGVKT